VSKNRVDQPGRGTKVVGVRGRREGGTKKLTQTTELVVYDKDACLVVRSTVLINPLVRQKLFEIKISLS